MARHFNIQFGGGEVQTIRRGGYYFPCLAKSKLQTLLGSDPYDRPNGYAWKYTAPLTWKQYVALLWRVKEWRVTGAWNFTMEVDYSTVGGPPDPVILTQTGTLGAPGTLMQMTIAPFDGELYITRNGRSWATPTPLRYYSDHPQCDLRPPGLVGVPLPTGTGSNGWLGDGFVGGGSIQLLLNTQYRDVTIFESNTFRPYFTFAVSGSSPGFGVQAQRGPGPPFSGRFQAPCSLSVDPVVAIPFAVDVVLEGVVDVPFTSASFVDGLGEFAMVATKFFSYKNRAGQLVYDESTGAQLADPFA